MSQTVEAVFFVFFREDAVQTEDMGGGRTSSRVDQGSRISAPEMTPRPVPAADGPIAALALAREQVQPQS